MRKERGEKGSGRTSKPSIKQKSIVVRWSGMRDHPPASPSAIYFRKKKREGGGSRMIP